MSESNMLRNIEELHEEASELCVKADYETAMTLWRRMLEIKPDDERAVEGIRLCEKLLAGEPLAPPIPAEVPAPDPAPLRAMELPMEDLGDAIDEALFGAGVLSAEPETVEMICAPLGMTPREEQADEAPEASIDADAANELRRRIEALLEEAQDFAETGNLAEAEQTLTRVLILDEENEHVRALQKTIQESREKEGGSVETPFLRLTDIDLELSDEEAEEAIPTLDTLWPVESSPEAVFSGDEGDSSESTAGEVSAERFGGEADAARAESAGETESKPAKKKSPPAGSSLSRLPPWARDRRVLLGAGGTLLVVAVGLGMGLSGGEDPVADPTLAAVGKPARGEAAKVPQAAPAPEAPPEAPPKDPAVLLQKADAAVEAEDWAGAVVVYNDLLKQVPDHVEALAGLPIAIERYRDQQEWQQKWDETVSIFEAGNYREALRLLYHMKDGEVARLDDYKINGWYNLGVADLQGNQCLDALEHFDEALEIRAGDQRILRAMSVADACLDAGRPTAEARALQFRSLRD